MKNSKKRTTSSVFTRYKAILEAVPDIIMEVDENKVYTWANPAGLTFFGDDVIGRQAADFFIGEQKTYDTVNPIFNGKENVIYVESWQRRQDGKIRLLAWWCKVLKNRRGKVAGALSSARDITESREAEERIRESEARFRAIFDHALDGIILADESTHFQLVNKSICKMLGYSEEELCRMSVSDIHPPEVLSEIKQYFMAMLAGEIKIAPDVAVKRKDGSVFFADVFSSDFRYSGKKMVVGFFRDVTERNRMMEALRQSEEHFRALIEASPMGIHIYQVEQNQEPVFIGYNPAAEKILGLDHREFMNKPLTQAFPGNAGTEVPERYVRAALNGELWHNEFIQYKDEHIVGAFDVYAFQIRRGLMAALFSDITERVRIEEELRRQRELVDRIMDTSPIGIVMVNKSGQITFANREAEKVLGLSKKDITRREYDDPRWEITAIDGSPYPSENLPFALVMDSKKPVTGIEHAIRLSDGTRRSLSINGTPLFDKNGEVDGVVFAMENITDRIEAEVIRKEMEAQLIQTQKLDSIGRLAGGVAHDLNNLLTPIIGYSDLYLTAGIKPGEDLSHVFQGIMNAAERAKTLVRQLLAFGRKQPMEMATVNLNALINQIMDMLTHTLRENIRITCELDEQVHNVKADHSQIDQIIINLATNAQDAMPEGGHIIIRTYNTELDEHSPVEAVQAKPGRYAVLAVGDTGLGMDETTTRHIFEPFYTTKNAGEGTGLGLATVYGIVKQHGGYIHVYSEPGKGSVFKVFLPDAEDRNITKPVLAAETRKISPQKILLVEDNDDVRLMTERMLQSLGHEVFPAAGGEEALVILTDHRDILLLVTDVIMPDLNGVELYRRLMEKNPALKVLYMSGYTDDIIKFHGVFGEDTPLIMKPFTIKSLAEKIAHIVRT